MISKITTAPNGQELVNKLNETIEQVNKGGGGGTGGGVTSVNGQTGDVTITVPTDNSQLANGAGYITNTALNPFVKSVTESGNIITVTKGDGSSNTINLPTGGGGGSGVEVIQFTKNDPRWKKTGSNNLLTLNITEQQKLISCILKSNSVSTNEAWGIAGTPPVLETQVEFYDKSSPREPYIRIVSREGAMDGYAIIVTI